MDIENLLVEDVILIHEDELELRGGLSGVHLTKLEAKLALPMSGYGGYERFPSIEEKAAVYHYYLASGHCFNDGNKRTSFLAAFVFLDFNGYDLIAENDDVFHWTLKLANADTRPDFSEAVNWIKNRMHKQE